MCARWTRRTGSLIPLSKYLKIAMWRRVAMESLNLRHLPNREVSLHYRVGHLLADLGWVDLDLECSIILPGQ